MGTGDVKNIYLSGWEYNRLLQKDPTRPRNSALPAEVLWNGAAQFWLFETVYCSAESLDNETDAGEMIGWATGKIFTELENEGVIQRADWGDLKPATKSLLTERHRALRTQYTPDQIRKLIRDRRVQELEAIKVELIEPVARHYQCMTGIGPNSLSEPAWSAPSGGEIGRTTALQSRAVPLLDKIAARVSRPTSPNGIVLCRPPGTGVSAEHLREQERVKQQEEMPRISDLLAGDGDFAGRRGWLRYHTHLAPYRAIYRPVDDQLEADWKANKAKLLRLRQAAERYLWPHLHGEWLPALRDDPRGFADEFGSQLDRSFRHPRLAQHFNDKADVVYILAGIGTFRMTSEVLEALASLPPTLAGAFGAAVATVSVYAAKKAVDRRSDAVKQLNDLNLFYQKAKKVLK